MSLLYNIGDWFTLGHGNTYRKIELYQLEFPENINLEHMNVFAAPYGGPIAITKNMKQLTKTGSSSKPIIYIFTCSGHLLSSINWNSGALLTLGWSDSEDLLCIQEDGVVLIYNIFGQYQHKFSMGQEAADTKVIDAKIFATYQATGVAVMTTHFRIFIVNNYKDPKVRLLPEIPKSSLDPASWAVIMEDRRTTCLITREQEIFKVKQDENICTAMGISLDFDYKTIRFISVSFNNRHVAMCTNTGILWMGSSDLRTKYCEFNTGRTEMPKQMEWCIDADDPLKAEALVMSYPSILLIVGINGDSNIYTYDPAVFLIPEMDGVRVLTNGYHELVQKVPKCVSNIFGISISEPSSFLFESHRKFSERSHQSDEYLCLIFDKIDVAVSECIEAASFEFDTETQKSLMRAAQFGKGFIKGHNPDEYIQVCRNLRVLNALREKDIGIPLTYYQLRHLTPTVVLDRLVFRKHYGLAIQIAKHLNLSESRILLHWAYHKIMFEKNDLEIIQKFVQKFKDPTSLGISFCAIAKKAEEVGKTDLAIQLLELEPNCSLQVPLLLKLNENKKALLAATQSGDTNLIYMVLMHLKVSTPLSKFQMIIRDFPLAQNLYKKYCQLNNVKALKDIYMQEDDFLAQAEMSLEEALDSYIKLDSSLIEISNNFKKGHKDVEAELSEDHRKLMKQQKVLEEKYARAFYGLSLHDTIRELLVLGDVKLAEKIKNDIKMSDKHFWYLRIEVLGSNYQWDELEKFSKSKKSPIGFEPFVEVCLKGRQLTEAKKYINKCRDDRKIIWYNRAGLYEESAKLAFELRDIDSLRNIHNAASTTNNRELITKIENFIAAMSGKK
ncbi:CLUMA_CG006503, isoform A [Clunio marinus]|uniref:Vacuolar protein sorting-associated protein 16 homolog n=1 Tax=Clunio marinus TaxID=568069 RepID=A0A1J1I0H2_9DIPT|nr:CLUMA_CG006503, isoform A [Clunio marinus]